MELTLDSVFPKNDNSKPSVWSLDPAIRNFSISNLELHKNLRIDFVTPAKFYKHTPKILRTLFEGRAKVIVYCEKQINLRRNPNIRYEYFLRGIMATLGNVTFVEVSASIKNLITRELYNWEYVKCRSKKAYKKALETCGVLNTNANLWTCYFMDNTLSIKQFKSHYDQKKYDDFLDTLILLDYNKYKSFCKSRQ